MIRSQIPKFRLPESVIDEEVGYILEHGRDAAPGRADRQPEGAARRGLRCRLRRHRRAARPRPRHPRPARGRRPHPYRHRLAVERVVRPYRQDRQARHRARRRQHRHGLLPHLAAPRRRGGAGRRAQRLRGDEGVALGEGGCHARRHPHPQLPDAQGLHPRGRPAHRRALREGGGAQGRRAAGAASCRRASPTSTCPATTCSSPSARRTPSPGSSATSAWSSTAGACRRSIPLTMQSTLPTVFFGGDSAFGPKNIIWAVAHGHDAAISIDKLCRGEDLRERPPPDVSLISQKMGIHEWSYDNDIANDRRYRVPLRDKAVALKNVKVEVELGFDRELAWLETQRCLNCDVQTVFNTALCIECDACVDICPMDCITFTANGPEDDLRTPPAGAGGQPRPGSLRLRRAQDRPHHGQGRGRLPALRPVRRALPDRRLGHAEIPPGDGAGRTAHATPARKHQRLRRQVRQRQRLRLGQRQPAVRQVDPAHGRADQLAQHLPVEHPGPADLVRGARVRGRLSRPPRRRRPDGRHESADLGQGRGRASSPAATCSTIRRSRCRRRSCATTSTSSACR